MKALISLCIVFLLVSVPGSSAQVDPTPPKTEEVKPQGYPVMLGDQTLFYIRDIQRFPAEVRAKNVSERIKRVAEAHHMPLTTSIYPQPVTLIMAGNELLMGLFEEDAVAEGRSLQELTADYSQKLSAAIEKYREERSLKRRLTGLLYTLIATLALIAILYLIQKSYRRGEARIQTWLSLKKVHIGIQTFDIVQAERVRTLVTGALKVIRVSIILVIFYTYFHLVLSFFPKTEAFASQLLDYVLVPFQVMGMAILAEIPKLFFVAIIALVVVYVLKLMRLFFSEVEKGNPHAQRVLSGMGPAHLQDLSSADYRFCSGGCVPLYSRF